MGNESSLSTNHNASLDSLRGYAALTVMLTHFSAISVATIEQNRFLGLYNFLTTGHQAVILFFILSGYVLSLSLSKSNVTYIQFIVRRLFRIYPVYLLIIILLLALYFISSKAVILRYMGADYQPIIFDFKFIYNSISLITPVFTPYANIYGVQNRTGFPLDIVTWSLTYEVIISLFFPLLHLLYTRSSLWFRFVILVVQLISAHLLINLTSSPIAYIYYYSSFFCIGIVLFMSYKFLSEVNLSKVWILIGFLLFAGDANNFFMPNFLQISTVFGDYITALGSFVLIVLCLSNNYFQNKINYFSRFNLGKVSYSLYLVHKPINFLLFYIFIDCLHISAINGFLAVVVKAIAVVLVIVISNITYKYIELPCIKIGRSII